MQISLVELGVAAVALGLGILVGWLLGRWRTERQWAGRMSVSTAQVAAAEARLASAGTQLAGFVSDRQAREGALEDARAEVARLREEQGRLRAGLEAEQRMAAEKLALLDEAQAKLRDVFKALSADALNTNNQAFLDLARAALGEYQANAARDLEGRHRAIDDLVRPLRESLDKVDAELRAMEQVRAGAYSTLAEQLRSLSATQQALHSETANLVKALRAPTVRGRWGEIQLKRVVEMAGMLDHCDFYEQQSGATEQGRLVPDLVVRLPGDRHIVVDAKVPLMAYLEALDASDDAGREASSS
jgi:DNA recombination protein RmuC